ncbi:hypothetical protein VSK90_04300 [Bacillus swezeyi]
MKDVLETIFTMVLQFLVEEKYVQLEHYFLDGTKIEANAIPLHVCFGKSCSQVQSKAARKRTYPV